LIVIYSMIGVTGIYCKRSLFSTSPLRPFIDGTPNRKITGLNYNCGRNLRFNTAFWILINIKSGVWGLGFGVWGSHNKLWFSLKKEIGTQFQVSFLWFSLFYGYCAIFYIIIRYSFLFLYNFIGYIWLHYWLNYLCLSNLPSYLWLLFYNF